jgi:hypothetical protein
LGEIIYKALIRIAITILLVWFSKDYFDEKYFWIMAFLGIYLFVFHPIIISYKQFIEKNQEIIQNTLCSSCKCFDETAVLCIKYDKHPTESYIPCEGTDWECK